MAVETIRCEVCGRLIVICGHCAEKMKGAPELRLVCKPEEIEEPPAEQPEEQPAEPKKRGRKKKGAELELPMEQPTDPPPAIEEGEGEGEPEEDDDETIVRKKLCSYIDILGSEAFTAVLEENGLDMEAASNLAVAEMAELVRKMNVRSRELKKEE